MIRQDVDTDLFQQINQGDWDSGEKELIETNINKKQDF